MHELGNTIRRDRFVQITCGYVVLWTFAVFNWLWFRVLPDWLLWIIFLPAIPLVVIWVSKEFPHSLKQFQWNIRSATTASVAFLPAWQLAVFISDQLSLYAVGAYAARIGTGAAFMIGLAWVVWGMEQASQHYDLLRLRKRRSDAHLSLELNSDEDDASGERIWNPLDTRAWYYGRKGRKLNQSVTGLMSYSFVFCMAFLIFSKISGCQELYEMPAGGGEQKPIAQKVKVQKVIKKKFIVNPFSAILFQVPPIDEVKLQLTEITKHAYTVGYGEGTGAGFAGGTKRGKVRFIRLEYTGGDWDQDFGVGADLNMLIEYNVRTQQQVADRTESRTVAQLNNFPKGKSPPVVYLTGQKNISLSKGEVKILKEYLLEKHGMLFGDNGGSRHFHNQFLAMMNRVLPQVRPVAIPLDDTIHRIPYQIPFLPYVAPHGGKEALGWKVDGRWVAYYHPGDIGDAWTDDHSGISPEIWEACYQLGTNVIFYGHTEYSKWLEAQKKK
ncbi:MAG: hypothetical protein CMJ78_08765 [Planctomycetaceae bacterium]|nr:hypothetical protein [Planctomycetaceae bacterium]